MSRSTSVGRPSTSNGLFERLGLDTLADGMGAPWEPPRRGSLAQNHATSPSAADGRGGVSTALAAANPMRVRKAELSWRRHLISTPNGIAKLAAQGDWDGANEQAATALDPALKREVQLLNGQQIGRVVEVTSGPQMALRH